MSRNLDISPRLENTRESNQIYKHFTLDEIKEYFDETINLVEKNIELAKSLCEENKTKESDEILRYQIVLLESALDFYCSLIFKYSLQKMYDNEWNKTESIKTFKVNLFDYLELVQDINNNDKFTMAIDNIVNKATYMGYKDINDCFNSCYKFDDGSTILSKTAEMVFKKGNPHDSINELKDFLKNLYNRRNSIVHSTDRSSNSGKRNEITINEVEEYKETLVKIIESINDIVRNISDIIVD